MDSDASTALRELRDIYRSAEDKSELEEAIYAACIVMPKDSAAMLLVCLEQLETERGVVNRWALRASELRRRVDDLVAKSEAFIAQVKVEREQFDAQRRAWEIERDRLQSLYEWALDEWALAGQGLSDEGISLWTAPDA